MKIKDLYSYQAKLDEQIHTNAKLSAKETLKHKSLALFVELGELANETRCFKYWSKKGPSEKSITIEEYVDGLHFLLSLGLSVNQDQNYDYYKTQYAPSTDLINVFNQMFALIGQNYGSWNKISHLEAMQYYIYLGSALGYSEQEICDAYLLKNEINHTRQNNNY